jgi:hypothetical protein
VPKKLDPRKKRRYVALRKQGWKQGQAAEEVGISRQTAHRLDLLLPPGVVSSGQLEDDRVPDPRTWDQLPDIGKRALVDFEVFATEFFVRRVPAWWRIAAGELVDAVTSEEQVFEILNAATGAGKTTLAEDLTLWLMCGGGTCDPAHGRSLRFMFGSATYDKAIRSVDKLRRIVESPIPFYDEKQRRQAEHSLVDVFGRFKPAPAEGDVEVIWRRDAFVVATVGDHGQFQRDPSVAAYSLGASPLQSRVDIAIIDDPASMRTLNQGDSLVEKFEAEFESRVEPSGALICVGQRLAPDDLYGQLAKRTWTDEAGEQFPSYQVLKFAAHRDHEGNEHLEWDGTNGCLLDAKRISWRKIQFEMTKPSFAAMYQQDPEGATALGLVERAWIFAGTDSTGFEAVGCFDDREFFQFLGDENGRLFPCYISIDPAQGEGYWALEVWQVDPKTRKRFLIAGDRGRYNVRDILSDDPSGDFGGVLHGLVLQSIVAGARPVAIVVEQNAARHWLQSQVWNLYRGFFLPNTLVIPFVTSPANRNDAVIGVAALLRPSYRAGEIRLPRRGDWNYIGAKIDELTSPRPKTADTVMAEWVGAASIDKIIVHAARYRRGPSPVVRVGGRNRQVNPNVEQPTATVYGQRVSQSHMPFQPVGADPYGSPLADVPIDQRSRNRVNGIQGGPMSEVARIALGLPTRRSPDRRDGRPDGTIP